MHVCINFYKNQINLFGQVNSLMAFLKNDHAKVVS